MDATGPAPRSAFLVIGAAPLSRRICQELAGAGHRVEHLVAPDDEALDVALHPRLSAVAIVMHDDVQALRYALAVAHLRPSLRIVATIFDRTIADRVKDLLPQAVVTSPAEVAAPSLAGPCLGADTVAAWEHGGLEHRIVRDGSRRVHRTASRRHRMRTGSDALHALLRSGSHDLSARLLATGLIGLLAVLAIDFAWIATTRQGSVTDAFLDAARVVATVGPAPSHAPAGYAVFSALAMLATVAFTAMFTAGLVERLLEPRLVALLGARSVPRRDHVIVVGMGQVGIRLCTELRRLGVRVVGVERDEDAPQLHVARALRLPVVVGHGGDREVLERVGLRRAVALAAVGSDEYDNIAVAIAANAIAPGVRVVLRAGEQEAIAETRSLLPLGITRDVWSLAAARIVDALHGLEDDAVARHLAEPPTRAESAGAYRRVCEHRGG